MATSFGEWMLRMVMLVLAGLVTLSILGALAAMSNSAARDVGEGTPAGAPVVPAPEPPPRPDLDARPGADDATPVDPTTVQEGISTVPISPPAATPEWTNRWLEAIAYALLALAGLLALAILALWRGVRHLRRLADAAEARRN